MIAQAFAVVVTALLQTCLTCLMCLSCLSCGTTGRSREPREGVGPESGRARLEEACALTEVRCSKCHSTARLRIARIADPHHWSRYVDRMRLMPNSGIVRDEATEIVRCLVFRSFGDDGLAELDRVGSSRQ